MTKQKTMNTPQTLKGFRDFLPKQMIVRKKAIAILTSVFESYGFEPLQTPTLEYGDVLMGKYGEEADKLLYIFQDRGGRTVGLNYDLTVPTARVLAQYPDLPKPFKRYQIQPSYRAENTQKGRYRQFTQCDIDIIGPKTAVSDAEILAVIHESLIKLRIPKFTIHVNSRAILYDLMKSADIPEDKWNTVLQTVDKINKKSQEELDSELHDKGFGTALFSTTIRPLLTNAEERFLRDQTTTDPYFNEVIALAKHMGVVRMKFNPSIVRGLDYYTGPIFETIVDEPSIGSVTGGGRYDNLISQLGGPDITAVGTTLGLDRLCDVIEELHLWQDIAPSVTTILISQFSPETTTNAIQIASTIRSAGLNTELYQDSSAKLEKQLKYAIAKEIPYFLIQGPEELLKGVVILKNLTTREQEEMTVEDVIKKLRS